MQKRAKLATLTAELEKRLVKTDKRNAIVRSLMAQIEEVDRDIAHLTNMSAIHPGVSIVDS